MNGVVRKLYIGGLIAATLCIAAFSWHDAALQYWRQQAAEDTVASGDVPWPFADDPQIRISLAIPRLQKTAHPLDQLNALAADARTVLREDPVNPDALYVLGVAAEQGRPGSGLGYFSLAERLSRRHIFNELALESVLSGQGDLAGAMARIDTIITVAPDMAYPVFTAIAPALPDATLRAALAPYAGRPWFTYLVQSAVANGIDTDTVLALFHQGERSIDPAMKDAIYAALIRRVVNDRDYDAARRLAAGLSVRDRQILAALGFVPGSADPRLSVLGWSLTNDATATAAIGGDGKLAISVAADHAVVVASRTTLLPPGSYVLTQNVAHDPASPRAGLTWDMACSLSPGMAFWHQPMPDHAGDNASYQSVISIPPGCEAQDWHLTASGESGQGPSTATVAGLQLHPG